MKLQGFPDQFQIYGNLSSQVRQISDAIPPPVAYALGTALQNFLCNQDTNEGTVGNFTYQHRLAGQMA